MHRGFAVELSSRLLTKPWPWANGKDNGNDVGVVGNGDVACLSANPTTTPGVTIVDAGGKTMLGLLVARAADTAPTVRRG